MKARRLLAAVLFVLAGMQQVWAAWEAYTVLKDGTLTFYYDGLKDSREGVLEIHNTYGSPYPYKAATTAVFDASFSTYRPTSTAYWFQNCSNLTSIEGLENLHTDDVTDMRYMFSSCSNLTYLSLSDFNTRNVTNMCNMFQMCWSLKSLDLSGFETSKVTDMSWMFQGCSSLKSLDLSGFNTGNVTNMQYMFSYCSSLPSLNLSCFDTANVTDMGDMFGGCSALSVLDLTSFNTVKVTHVSSMFSNCSALKAIHVSETGWNMESVTQGSSMFWNCTSLVGANGTTYDDAHTGIEYASIDTPEQPGYLSGSVRAYAVLSEDGKTVTFYYDNQSRSRNDVFMIHDSSAANPYKYATTAVFDPSFADYRPISTAYWFQNCSNLTSIDGLENLHTDDVTDMHNMFSGCTSVTSLDLSGFKTSKVSNMSNMFYSCGGLKELNLRSFDTWSVVTMKGMFAHCKALTTLDISSFSTAYALDMSEMFAACNSLTFLDLGSFNTLNVKNMDSMFEACNNLKTIYVDKETWSVNKERSTGENMFNLCTSLVGGNGTKYDDAHTGIEYACVDKPGQPGYLTSFEKYDLKIVGKQVTSENCSDFYGDGTVSFDPETCTLTLNNANIIGDNEKSLIETKSPLNIVLKGENTVSDVWCETCIYANLSDSDGEVHITGPGSLNVVGGGIGIGVSAGLSIDGGAQVKVQGEEGGIFAVMKLSISGKETVVMAKAGQLPIASINLTLNDGLIVGLPEGASCKYIQFGEEIEQSLYTVVDADGNIVVNDWVVIASQDYITGVESISDSPEEEGQAYNLAGQKVGDGYRGIVVKKGRKLLKK